MSNKRVITFKIDEEELEEFDKRVGKRYCRSEIIRMLMKAYVSQRPCKFRHVCLLGRLVGVEVDGVEKDYTVDINWDVVSIVVDHTGKPEEVVVNLVDRRVGASYERTVYSPLENTYIHVYRVPRYNAYINVRVASPTASANTSRYRYPKPQDF